MGLEKFVRERGQYKGSEGNKQAANARDPGSNVGKVLGRWMLRSQAEAGLQAEGSRRGGPAGRHRGGRQGEGAALVEPSRWAVGRVRMRVRRRDIGTGKKEPTGICNVELSAKMVKSQNFTLCHATRGGGGSAGRHLLAGEGALLCPQVSGEFTQTLP